MNYGLLIDKDSEFLDAARSALFSSRKVLYAVNNLFRAEVDDQKVREICTLYSLPIGALLKVEDFIAPMVAVFFF